MDTFSFAEQERGGKVLSRSLRGAWMVVCLAALFWAGPSSAQDGFVRGYVTSETTGRPLPGANVVLRDTSGPVRGTVVDERGFYQISGLTGGQYHLRVSHVGYAPARDTLSLRPGAARTHDVALRPRKKRLEAVRVEARQGTAQARAGHERIASSDIERIPTPGPGGDLASFLRTEPGVAVLGDRGGRVHVRGGTPSQNLILVDGTPIYRPFHLIGQYSAFPSELVAGTDVYAGGYGAEYAGRLSSVIDVRLRPGNKKSYEGSVATSPFLNSARIEGPIGRDRERSFLVLLRQSSIEWSAPALIGQDVPIRFHDVTAKGHFGAGRDHCSLTLMHTYDRGRIDPNATETSFLWTNNVAALSCRALGDQTPSTVEVNVGLTHLLNEVRLTRGTGRSSSRWGLHGEIDYVRPVSWGEVRVGGRIRNDQLQYDLNEKFFFRRSDLAFGLTFGGHVGARWEVTEAFDVRPSVAVLAPLSWGRTSVEPRLRLAWRPWDAQIGTFSGALGRYRQPITGIRDVRDVGAAFTAWAPTPVDNQMASALHGIVGWSHQLAPGVTAGVEGYYKRMRNLPVPEWSTIARFTTSLALADGTAYGVDTQLSWRHSPLHVTLGYGYGWVQYRVGRDAIGTGGRGRGVERYHPAHDRRHKLSLTASGDFRPVRIDLTWQYGTGRPFTQAFGFDTALNLVGVQDHPNRDLGTPRLLYRRPYQARLPAYHRLDVSAQRRIPLSETVRLNVKLGAINAYDRRNLFYYDLYTLRRVDQLPLVPYLSLRFDLQ
jgi:hypothetical protein